MAKLPRDWEEQAPRDEDGPGPIIHARWESECECGSTIYEGDQIRVYDGVALCLDCAKEVETE